MRKVSVILSWERELKYILFLITRDDVVSQRLKFGAHSFRILGSQKLPCFLTFPYPEPAPKKLCDF